MQPRAIPKEVAVFKEAELPPEPAGGGAACSAAGVTAVFLAASARAQRRGAAASSSEARTQSRIKLGGQVQAAKVIAQPQPVYPASGAAGPHSGQRCAARDHRQGRHA